MRQVYGLALDIPVVTDGDYEYEAVRLQCQEWLVNKYPQFRWPLIEPGQTREFVPRHGHVVVAELWSDSSSKRLTLIQEEQGPQSRWNTHVVVAKHAEQGVSFRLELHTNHHGSFAPPKLVRSVIEHLRTMGRTPTIGTTPVECEPIEVSQEFVPHLVELLTSPRTVPIVVAARDLRTDEFVVDIKRLNGMILGLAPFVLLKDRETTQALTDALTKNELGCYDGALRIYWPGFNLSSNPYDHPLYLKWGFLKAGRDTLESAQPLFSTVAEATSPRSVLPSRVEQAIDDQIHLTKERRQTREAAVADLEGLRELLSLALSENHTLEQDVKRLKAVNATIEAELKQAQQNIQVQAREEEDRLSPQRMFGEMLELYGDGVRISKDAWKSIEDIKTKDRDALEKLRHYLLEFGRFACQYLHKPLGDGPVMVLRNEFQLDASTISSTQKNNADKTGGFDFDVDGESTYMPLHLKPTDYVKPPECFRIHFARERDNGPYWIGYCGLHARVDFSKR